MMLRWVNWCRCRNGNDGRSRSGVGFTRTTRAHLTEDGLATLCGLEVGPLCRPNRRELPYCNRCRKKLRETMEPHRVRKK